MQLILFLSVLFFASRGFGLNINIGNNNFTAVELLDLTLPVECQSICSTGTLSVQTCAQDDACLCSNSVVNAVRACEQCLFTFLVENNQKASDPRFGSSSALTAYSAACLASVNVTIPTTQLGLTLPANWDGPISMELGTAATALTVLTGGILGIGSIYLLCAM